VELLLIGNKLDMVDQEKSFLKEEQAKVKSK
jgi:hypothetical protein